MLGETPLDPEQRDLLRTVQVSGQTRMTVINDILDDSRIESGRMEMEKEPVVVADVGDEERMPPGTCDGGVTPDHFFVARNGHDGELEVP